MWKRYFAALADLVELLRRKSAGCGIIYRSAKAGERKTTFEKEDITKEDLSTNRGRFPQKTGVFPQNYVTLALCLVTEGQPALL